MRIAISPDENPGDPGAIHNGIVERQVNVLVAGALETALKRCHQDAWFDPNITYTQRVIRANHDGTQLLVACAHNAAGSPAAEGALFLFCGPAAHKFGKQQRAAENCGRELVAAGLAGHFGFYDENVVECCDFNHDSVYCEFGYETNATDAARIKQPGYPTHAAEALCKGLAETYGFAYVAPAQLPPHPVQPPVTMPPVQPPAQPPVQEQGGDKADPTENRPSNLPPIEPPAAQPPAQQGENFLEAFVADLEQQLVDFADHELIRLIQLGINELKRRAA